MGWGLGVLLRGVTSPRPANVPLHQPRGEVYVARLDRLGDRAVVDFDRLAVVERVGGYAR